MVSLTELRNRLQPWFTPEQAERIANLHMEMQDRLVTRHDLSELRSVVDELARSQHRPEKRVDELAEAQHELAEAKKHAELVINDLAKQVGGLAGMAWRILEVYARAQIPELLAERCGFLMASCDSKSNEAKDKPRGLDVVPCDAIYGRPGVVLFGMQMSVYEPEVRGFLRVVDRLRPVIAKDAGDAVRPLLSGYQTASVAQHFITESGARLAVPRGLVPAA